MWTTSKSSLLLLALWLFLPIVSLKAQQMTVKDFRKSTHLWPLPKHYPIDKKQAWLDFFTAETDFSFLADGKTPIEAQPGEGLLTLLLPHRTQFVVIQHPRYGLYTWKVPGKSLRKKKHYQATLVTFDTEKPYELQKQWTVFHISPSNALLWVDSIMTPIRTGTEQFFLPLGQHTYRVEAPFYRTVTDTFHLDDSKRTVIRTELQPLYSYLNVRTPLQNADIYVDGEHIGQGEGTSGRLQAGTHRLRITVGHTCLYDRDITLDESEKKEMTLQRSDLSIQPKETFALTPDTTDSVSLQIVIHRAPVVINAPAPDTEILINRETIGYGTWQGKLPLGTYAVQTRKKGLESDITWIHIPDTLKKEFSLTVPQTTYGTLSISSNVVNAEVWINDSLRGYTPCVIEHLPAQKACQIALRKAGYKEVLQTVVPPRNNLLEIKLKLKRKK